MTYNSANAATFSKDFFQKSPLGGPRIFSHAPSWSHA